MKNLEIKLPQVGETRAFPTYLFQANELNGFQESPKGWFVGSSIQFSTKRTNTICLLHGSLNVTIYLGVYTQVSRTIQINFTLRRNVRTEEVKQNHELKRGINLFNKKTSFARNVRCRF